MRRLLMISVITALFATACSSGSNSLSASVGAKSSSWCDVAREIDNASNAMDSPTGDGVREFAKQVKASLKIAPAEIKPDIEVLSGFLDDLSTALKDNNDNIMLAFDAMGNKLNDPKYSDAGDKITAYNERECGIVDTNSSGTTDTTGTTDTIVPEGGLIAGLAGSLGITEDQARCLVSKFDFTGSTTPPISELFSYFSDCGIDPATIGG